MNNEPRFIVIDDADLLSVNCANALLKLIEEPPKNTLFIFVAEDDSLLIDTLVSRCQKTVLNKIPSSLIKKALKQRGFSDEMANKASIESNGNYNKALSLV